jgi:hypothetical protein
MMQGCSATAPTQEATLNLLVRQATVRALQNKPERAPRAKEIIGEARQLTTGEKDVTVALAVAAMRGVIEWDRLTPADRLLIEDIMTMIQIDLENHLGSGILNPEQKAFLDKLLQSAEQAASLVGARPA